MANDKYWTVLSETLVRIYKSRVYENVQPVAYGLIAYWYVKISFWTILKGIGF